jgi:diguanylate cyclase (GGDEF)-like protein
MREGGKDLPFPDCAKNLFKIELEAALSTARAVLEAERASIRIDLQNDRLRFASPESHCESPEETHLVEHCLAQRRLAFSSRGMSRKSRGSNPRNGPFARAALPIFRPHPPLLPVPYIGGLEGAPLGALYLAWARERASTPKLRHLLAETALQAARTAAGALRYISSITDSLTGAFTRKYFEELLEFHLHDGAAQNRKSGVLLIIDIDELKKINDSFGFSAGDEVIAGVASRISRCLGESEFLARFGGEEFALLLAGAGKPEALRKARAIQKEIRGLALDFLPRPPTVTMGGAVFPDHGSRVEELVRNADRTLWTGKKNGKNRIEFCGPRSDSAGWSARRLAAFVTGDQSADQRNVQILLDTMSKVNAQVRLEEIFHTVLKASLSITGAERAILLLHDRSKLTFKAGIDSQGRALSPTVRFSLSIPENAAASGESICVKDTSVSPAGRGKSIQELALRSIMCVPLKGSEKIIGTLYVDSPAKLTEFEEADLAFFEAIASQCALAVENAALGESLKEENRALKKSTADYGARPLIGLSPAIRNILKLIPELAASTSPLLITGESGTGKELLARAIHAAGTRKNMNFIAQNCAAIPPDLLESELFGHARGAFSGALKDKKGLIELAEGGTFMLDEIGDMNPLLQAKLLRVLEEKSVRRIGETEPMHVDFRLISATHRELDAAVAAGQFRADLLYRIRVLTVHIPPLRERREDIPLLVHHFLDLHSREKKLKVPKIPRETMDFLCSLELSGNVRELSSLVEKGMMLANGRSLSLEHLGVPAARKEKRETLRSAKENLEQDMIRKALERARMNLTEAARSLGIHRQQLQRLIRRYRISV